MIVHFVDIGGIVYHHCLDFLFIIQCHQKHFPLTGVFKCIPVCLKPPTMQVNMTFYQILCNGSTSRLKLAIDELHVANNTSSRYDQQPVQTF